MAPPKTPRPIHLESRSTTLDSTDIHQPEVIEEKPLVQSAPEETIQLDVPTTTSIEPIHLEQHLEARPATIEPIDVPSEPTPIVIPKAKHDESVVSKALDNLHGASVDLPQVDLVTPGPLPALTLNKEKTTKKPKKSSVGLCASCFGGKAAEKKKKKGTTNAPIEPKKTTEDVPAAVTTPVEIVETIPSAVVHDEVPLISPAPIEILESEVPLVAAAPVEPETVEVPLVSPAPLETTVSTEIPTPVEPAVIEEITHELPKLEDRLDATIEQLVMPEEPHYQLPSSEPVPPVVIQENEYSLPDGNDYDVPRSFETVGNNVIFVLAVTFRSESFFRQCRRTSKCRH